MAASGDGDVWVVSKSSGISRDVRKTRTLIGSNERRWRRRKAMEAEEGEGDGGEGRRWRRRKEKKEEEGEIGRGKKVEICTRLLPPPPPLPHPNTSWDWKIMVL